MGDRCPVSLHGPDTILSDEQASEVIHRISESRENRAPPRGHPFVEGLRPRRKVARSPQSQNPS